jgi:quinoprotein dehydrogenase-associated probable ABC transporter substrate-binding protein
LVAAETAVLRVCADPNNLPFSNDRGEGFENKLAELAARSLGAKLEYAWVAQRRGYVRQTLGDGLCDVLPGVPSTLDTVDTTAPYYRSAYVFVSRKDRGLRIASLADPALEKLRIGIHLVGKDYAPPAVALGLARNLVTYSLLGTYGEPNPPSRLIDAVANGDVDVAIAWGPLAGYFAKHERTPLVIQPVSPAMYLAIPFAFDISMGVRKGDAAMKTALEGMLRRECGAIRQILADYGVPLVDGGKGEQGCETSGVLASAPWSR